LPGSSKRYSVLVKRTTSMRSMLTLKHYVLRTLVRIRTVITEIMYIHNPCQGDAQKGRDAVSSHKGATAIKERHQFQPLMIQSTACRSLLQRGTGTTQISVLLCTSPCRLGKPSGGTPKSSAAAARPVTSEIQGRSVAN
jgi:hypothetical protein